MIDLANEKTISLSAARMLPPGRRSRSVTLSCLLRWVLDGMKAPTGEKVRLEALRFKNGNGRELDPRPLHK